MVLKRDLQDECKALGLCSTGTVADLVQRLQNFRNRDPSSSPDENDPMAEAILVTESKVCGEEDMKTEAKAAFVKVLANDELNVTTVRGEVYVCNSRGLGLAGLPERFRILELELLSLKDKQEKETLSLKEEIQELNSEIMTLKLAGQDYRRVRQRFISTFVRDKLGCARQSDINIIKEVNLTVHRGDAVVDALLYNDMGVNGRQDSFAFEELYGIHPFDVKKICE